MNHLFSPFTVLYSSTDKVRKQNEEKEETREAREVIEKSRRFSHLVSIYLKYSVDIILVLVNRQKGTPRVLRKRRNMKHLSPKKFVG